MNGVCPPSPNSHASPGICKMFPVVLFTDSTQFSHEHLLSRALSSVIHLATSLWKPSILLLFHKEQGFEEQSWIRKGATERLSELKNFRCPMHWVHGIFMFWMRHVLTWLELILFQLSYVIGTSPDGLLTVDFRRSIYFEPCTESLRQS